MPIIKSAKKRVKTSRKASIRNAKTKRATKAALKGFAKKPSAEAFNSAQSKLDTAAKKHVIHKNKAARLKRRLAAQAKAAGVKQTAGTKKAAPAKKPATKSSATKKSTPAKKAPATKTASAKKK